MTSTNLLIAGWAGVVASQVHAVANSPWFAMESARSFKWEQEQKASPIDADLSAEREERSPKQPQQ